MEIGKETVKVRTEKNGIGLFAVTHKSRNHEVSLGGLKADKVHLPCLSARGNGVGGSLPILVMKVEGLTRHNLHSLVFLT